MTIREAADALRACHVSAPELAPGRDRGPLHGIPVAVKNLFATRGVRTTYGSKVYETFVPDADAATVERLVAAGAVMLGKLNMHELCYGITSANPHFGPALSIPCGLGSSGLPIGIQIIGPAFEEALILRIGAALEDGGVGVPPMSCRAGPVTNVFSDTKDPQSLQIIQREIRV